MPVGSVEYVEKSLLVEHQRRVSVRIHIRIGAQNNRFRESPIRMILPADSRCIYFIPIYEECGIHFRGIHSHGPISDRICGHRSGIDVSLPGHNVGCPTAIPDTLVVAALHVIRNHFTSHPTQI